MVWSSLIEVSRDVLCSPSLSLSLDLGLFFFPPFLRWLFLVGLLVLRKMCEYHLSLSLSLFSYS